MATSFLYRLIRCVVELLGILRMNAGAMDAEIWFSATKSPCSDVRSPAMIASELVQRCKGANYNQPRVANELERQIGEIVTRLAPHCSNYRGMGVRSAAKLVGEAAGVHRFRAP